MATGRINKNLSPLRGDKVVRTNDWNDYLEFTSDGKVRILVDVQEVEFRTTATHIQWRKSEGEWQNLVALEDIKGEVDENLELSTLKVGDVEGGNYSEIEADGTFKAVGDATVYNDSQVPPTVFRTGGTALLLAELVSGIYAHRFDTGGSPDMIHFNVQFPHSMKLNSTIYPHLHVVNKDAIVGAANVSFTLTYTWANINGTFPAVKEDTKVVSFADAEALTHKLLSFDPIVPVAGQGGLSSILIGTLTRVNTGYTTANIFHMGFDIHYEVDALGSREEFVK
jgi:hypothetical protein